MERDLYEIIEDCNQKIVTAETLIPGAEFVFNFYIRPLHFTFREIQNTSLEGMESNAINTLHYLTTIRTLPLTKFVYKDLDQLAALGLCISLRNLQKNNINTLEQIDLLRLLSVSRYTGDPAIPELNPNQPPVLFRVNRVFIRYINGELTISCYFNDQKVYESKVGHQ